jgi:hypothetical protein
LRVDRGCPMAARERQFQPPMVSHAPGVVWQKTIAAWRYAEIIERS